MTAGWLLPPNPPGGRWREVPQTPCPACGCCTAQLCSRARVEATSCQIEVDVPEPAGEVVDVSGCPCAPHAALGELGEVVKAWRDDSRRG